MPLDLPASVASTQDLVSLIIELQDYARWHAHESIKRRISGGRVSPAPLLSRAAEELVRARGGTSITSSELTSLIKQLERHKATAPAVTITLAAPPTQGVKTALVSWCRTNIAGNVLVTFAFNGTLLGGMVIRSGSRVIDASFRRQILENRIKFPEVLRRV